MPGRPHHTDKMHRCVEEVMAKGHEEASAWAICTASLEGAGEDIYNQSDHFQALDDGAPIDWQQYALGKPFKPFKKKKPGEKSGDKPKWTPPWLKK